MSRSSLFVFLVLTFLRGVISVSTTDTNIVYCQEPVTATKKVSYCNTVYTLSLFPNSLGYASFPGSASVITSIWDSDYVSVSFSTLTITTLVHKALGYPINDVCAAKVVACNPTPQLFTAYVTYYTVFAPSAGSSVYTGLPYTETATVTSTVILTASATTCPVVDTTTVTKSVSYAIGSGNQLTIYTPGPEPGTSTYLSCN